MIKINEVASWFEARKSAFVQLGGSRRIDVWVRNVERSIAFYSRVFGFRVTGYRHSRGHAAAAVMRATARGDLVLHARLDETTTPTRLPCRWGFLVSDLDSVRAMVWELGVSIARDSGAPDHIYRWSNGRLLYVKDPDANEIALVELWTPPTASLQAPPDTELADLVAHVGVALRPVGVWP